MSTLGHVTIESKPAHTPALFEWPQPFRNGDDGLDWYADITGQGVGVKIQRDRLTDDVYWCSAKLDLNGAGQSGFSVITGAASSPATGWSAPNLTGLKMRWTWAAEGSIHDADFTDVTHEDILRDGHNVRQVRRYVMSKVTNAGSGNLVLTEGVLCHHVYLTYRADLPNVVKMEVRMSNAAGEVETSAASIAARGGGIKCTGTTQLNSIGFSDCDLILPTVGTWLCVQDRAITITGVPQAHTVIADATEIPVAGPSNAHVFPRKMWTRRRFVLYRTDAGATLQQAQDLLAWKGLGRAEASDANPDWRSYHTERAFGPSRSALPRLDLGFAGGYPAATTQCGNNWTNLSAAVAAGFNTFSSQGGEFGEGTGSARFGLFQFVGTSDPQAPGGQDIGTFCGGTRHVPGFVRFASLYSSLKLDGSAVALYERTTGKPLRSYDFAAAYAGGTIQGSRYTVSASYAGRRQPFTFYCQNNGGYEYRVSDQSDFAGWTKREPSWPLHYYDGSRWWPDRTSLWGAAPRSNWNFVCDYWPLLEGVPVSATPDASPHPTFSTTYPHLQSTPFVNAGTPGSPLGSGACWKDPEDDQHCIRMYRHLIPLAWLGGDLMAIDDLSMLAEWFGLEYSELGWPKLSSPDPFSLGVNNRCLGPGIAGGVLGPGQAAGQTQGRLATQNNSAHTAAYGTGRADAWVSTLFAADFALATAVRRDEGYPVYGVKARAKMMFDFIRLGVITINGMTDRQTAPDLLTITGGTGCIPATYAIASSPDPTLGPVLYFTLRSDLDAVMGRLNSINNGAGNITDNSVAGFITRSTSGGAATVLSFTGANWISAARQITHATAFLPYVFASGSISGGTSGYIPAGEIEQRYRSQQAGLELPKLYFGYFSLFKQLGAVLSVAESNEAATHFVTQWREYTGRHTHYVDYWTGFPNPPSNGQWGPPNYVAVWDAQTGAPVNQDTAVPGGVLEGGPFHNGGHWPEALVSLEIAYRISGNIGVLQTANRLAGPQVPITTPPDTRAATIMSLDSYYAPGLIAMMQTQGGVDTDFVPPQTNPTVQARATPNPVLQGTNTVIGGVVVAGANPTSTGLRCYVTYPSNLGGLTVQMLDDGIAPDTVAGDLKFATSLSTSSIAPGAYPGLLVQVFDDQGRSGADTFTLNIGSAATNPTVTPSVAPFPVQAGATLKVFGLVVLGTAPASTGVTVVADCSALGGPAALSLLDTGVAPDVSAGDLIYTGSFVVPVTLAAAQYSIPVVVHDAQGRLGSGTITAKVTAAPVGGTLGIQLSFSANPINAGQTATVFGRVTLGSTPTVEVTTDFSSAGGSSAQPALDDGIAPDLVAGDLIFTTSRVMAAAGEFNISATVTEKGSASVTDVQKLTVLAVVPSTNPAIFPIASPNPVVQASATLLTVQVVPGTAPASTAIAVTVDLSLMGGSAAQALADQGGGIWTYSFTPSLAVLPGTYEVAFSMTDAQARNAKRALSLVVLPYVPVATPSNVFLPVRDGQTVYRVPLNAAQRLVVTSATGTPYEIQSSPDAAASAGGQVPILLEDGVSVALVPFTVLVQPPVDPPPVPVKVVVGQSVGGERKGSASSRRELVGAG